MNTSLTYTKACRDAGLLRQYAAQQFGQALTFGCNFNTGERAHKVVCQLSRMTGTSRRQVVATIISDYAEISE